MQRVEIHPGKAASPYLVHRRFVCRPPGVGEAFPVRAQTACVAEGTQLARNAGAPVDERPEHVEKQRFRRAHSARFASSRAAPGPERTSFSRTPGSFILRLSARGSVG